MKQSLKLAPLAGALALALAIPASADVPMSDFERDMRMAFENDGEPMELAMLSEQEMAETKGAVWPFVTNWISRMFWGSSYGSASFGLLCLDNPYACSDRGSPRLMGEFMVVNSILALFSTNFRIATLAGFGSMAHGWGGFEGPINKFQRISAENGWTLRGVIQRVGDATNQYAEGLFDPIEPYAAYSMSKDGLDRKAEPFWLRITQQLPQANLREFFSDMPRRELTRLLRKVAPGTTRSELIADLSPKVVNSVLTSMPERHMRRFVGIVPSSIMTTITSSSPALASSWVR